jgi:hypothetical protein
MVTVVTNISYPLTNLYYQAEQNLSPLLGTRAYGNWRLEVLDNRTGATNTDTLLSWQLQFVFANTNLPPMPKLLGFQRQTNQVTAGSIFWYQVNVPATANFATNILVSATAPVNLLFSTNHPPTTSKPGDAQLLAASTGDIGSPVLSTTTTPALVPGGTNYLGVQNLNAITVTSIVEVDFDHGNLPPGPLIVQSGSVKVSSSGKLQFSWTAGGSGHYQVQWKNSLTGVWNTITNPNATTANGVSTFTDDGSQSAPLGQMRFYRLVWVP